MTDLCPRADFEGKFTDSYAYIKDTEASVEFDIAVYEGEKMTDFKKLSESAVTIEAYDTKTFDVSPYQGKSYKLFFWKDLTNVFPICYVYSK